MSGLFKDFFEEISETLFYLVNLTLADECTIPTAECLHVSLTGPRLGVNGGALLGVWGMVMTCLFTKVRVGGQQVRSIIKDGQQPIGHMFACSRIWFLLKIVSFSVLHFIPFLICVVLPLVWIMTSSPPVFRSGLLLTCNCLESVFIWYLKLTRGPHKCCLCFSESFHVCNQLVSVTWGSREWWLPPELSGTTLHLSAPTIKQTFKYLSCYF